MPRLSQLFTIFQKQYLLYEVVGHWLIHDTNLIFQFQNIFQPSSFLNADDSSIDSICKSMLGIYKPWMLKQFDPQSHYGAFS